jgi:hypothetical protein
MADQLYLSLWFPNFRFAVLPEALVGVMRQFARISISGDKNISASGDRTGGQSDARVSVATVFPIDWTESPIYQRIYVLDPRAAENTDISGSIIENAVAEATNSLHEDMAYEFEMKWNLWTPEAGCPGLSDVGSTALDPLWKLEPTTVKIIGFGPEFDNGGFEQNGQIRIDFGLDTPWVLEEDETAAPLDANTTQRIQQNVEKLLAFTLSVEKHCGISSRLLWTESGELLAEKLIARLQRLN